MNSSPPGPVKPAHLLEPRFLRQLEQAAIATRHIHVGRTKGERRSARKGSSVEFADFRAYSHGDDLRYVDWNAFARLQRLFLKLFVDEEDLYVYLLIDTSSSMGFGAPSKLRWAQEAAAALAYLALGSGDRVELLAHSGGERRRSDVLRGKGCATEAFAWLCSLEAASDTSLTAAVDWALRVMPAPGIIFVLSDLLTADWLPALRRLAAARAESCILQVLSQEDWSPSVQGDLRLVDSETGSTREITMGASVLRRYVHERDALVEGVRAACNGYGFSYIRSLSTDPVEDVILRELRRLGVVR